MPLSCLIRCAEPTETSRSRHQASRNYHNRPWLSSLSQTFPQRRYIFASTLEQRWCCPATSVPKPWLRLVNSLKNVLAKRTVFSYIWSIGLDDRPNGLGRPGRFAGLTGRGTQKEKGRVCKTLFGGSIPSRASNPSKIWSTKYPETFLKSIALVRDDRRLCSAKPSQPDLHSLALYPMHFIPGLCARHVHLCCEPICSHLSNLPARSFLMASAPCAH